MQSRSLLNPDEKIGIPLSIGFIKRRLVLATTLDLNPIGKDAIFFQLAGEKAGLKLPNALNCSFPNQKKVNYAKQLPAK